MSVQIHIERLVLDGLSIASSEGPPLAAAVEQELSRLLYAAGLPGHERGIANVPAVEAGEISIQAGSEPAELGRQIAGALYRGVGR